MPSPDAQKHLRPSPPN